MYIFLSKIRLKVADDCRTLFLTLGALMLLNDNEYKINIYFIVHLYFNMCWSGLLTLKCLILNTELMYFLKSKMATK